MTTNTTSNARFKTIKAAKQSGYRERRPWEYGGEEIVVKGRRLVRDSEQAVSRTEWDADGFRLRPDAEPHCTRRVWSYQAGIVLEYPVYRDDQVEPKREIAVRPPVLIDELHAVWGINRRAKRCRDLATSHYAFRRLGLASHCKLEKEELYRLKGQALQHLLEGGRLEVVGHHRFPGGNWAEVLSGARYTFHRPCPPRDATDVKELAEIEAKPKSVREPRLKDALYTIEKYLAAKPKVELYEWPPVERVPSGRWLRDCPEDVGEEEDDDLDWDENRNDGGLGV